METEERIKPVIILPENEMPKEDIKALRDNGLCVVECKNPEVVRFLDPPPQGYDEIDSSALELFRTIIRQGGTTNVWARDISHRWAQVLVNGRRPTPVERVKTSKKKSR